MKNLLNHYSRPYFFWIFLTSNDFEKYEYEYLGGWYSKPTIYTRFLNWHKTFKKIKQLQPKLRSLW